ncbi:Phosphatidylinositol-glycan biosynthesis class W protein [Trichinella spiralis]|uniref:Phosphatidylinositol-glycan biosynthesis class W protein n=1 Tax=Trichinella spiralis TaxID=6334 RepID=A0ABR3K4R2_TRISP
MVSLKVKPPLVGNHWKSVVVEQFSTTNTDHRSAKVPSSRRLLSSLCFFLSAACTSNWSEEKSSPPSA